jgi:hypothetical protein
MRRSIRQDGKRRSAGGRPSFGERKHSGSDLGCDDADFHESGDGEKDEHDDPHRSDFDLGVGDCARRVSGVFRQFAKMVSSTAQRSETLTLFGLFEAAAFSASRSHAKQS